MPDVDVPRSGPGQGRPACVPAVCSLCVVERGGRGRDPALRAGGSRACRGLAIGPNSLSRR